MNTHRTLFSPRRIGWILVGLVMGLALPMGSPAQEVTAFVGARIWDGTGAEAISNGLMLVRDGRIQYVGERGDVPLPSGATVVNVNGRTIIPGLINTHGHVGGTGPYNRENLTRQLRLYAEYGITTVNSLGGDGPEGIALRDEQSMTGLDRARIFVAGAVVTGNTVDAALDPGATERGHGRGLDEAPCGRQPGRAARRCLLRSTLRSSTAATSSACGWLPTSST